MGAVAPPASAATADSESSPVLPIRARRRCDNPTRDNSVLSPKPLLLVIKR
jgi:hypothetical protein